MTDYEQRTIGWIRLVSLRLAQLPDEALCALYRQWSEMWHASGWLADHPGHIKEFCDWATKAPCESYEPKIVAHQQTERGRP